MPPVYGAEETKYIQQNNIHYLLDDLCKYAICFVVVVRVFFFKLKLLLLSLLHFSLPHRTPPPSTPPQRAGYRAAW